MYRWLAAAVVLGCWGCAFSLDGPDPNRPRNYAPKCDSSKGLVALDGVMATGLGVTALAMTSDSEPAAALLPLGLGALYLAGAISGNRTANACQAALDDYSRTYGDERMVLEDGSIGAPPVDDDDDDDTRANRRAKQQRQAGQRPGWQAEGGRPAAGYPPQGYPQRGQPQQQPQQTPQQPVPAQQVPPQQAPSQQAPQQPPPQQPSGQAKPAKTKAPPPPPDDGDGDWSDFWREVP